MNQLCTVRKEIGAKCAAHFGTYCAELLPESPGTSSVVCRVYTMLHWTFPWAISQSIWLRARDWSCIDFDKFKVICLKIRTKIPQCHGRYRIRGLTAAARRRGEHWHDEGAYEGAYDGGMRGTGNFKKVPGIGTCFQILTCSFRHSWRYWRTVRFFWTWKSPVNSIVRRIFFLSERKEGLHLRCL